MSSRPKYTALTLRVIPALPDSLPGYEGDARIFWETARLHNQQEAVEVTLSGLKVLRDFWVSGKEGSEEAPSETLRQKSGPGPAVNFATFFKSVCKTLLPSENTLFDDNNSTISNAHLSKLAGRLVETSQLVPAFLTDLRDWDAFRLLMRRHSVQVCVLPMDYANDLILQTTRSETATSHASTSTEHATVILVTHNNEEDSSDGAEADNEMESLERKPTNASASTTSSSERSSIGIGRINCPEDTPLITQLQDQLQTLAQDYENSIALWGMEKETILSALYASNSKLFAVKKAIQAPLMAESPHSNPPAINNNASSSPSSSATSSTVEAASRIVAGIVSKRPKSILKNRGIFDISSASTDTLKIDDDESNGEEAAESSSSTTPSSIVKKRVQWTSVVISAHEEKERRKRIKTSFISLSSTLMMDDEVVAEGEINESKSIGDFSFTGSSSSSSSSGEEGVVEEEDDPTDEELDTFSAMVRENLKSPRIQNGIGANSDIKLMIQVTPASPTSNVDDDEDCVILSAKSFDTLLEEEQGLMKVAALKSSGSSISSIERRHTTPPCDAISDSKTNINEATEETNVVAVGSSGSSSTNINADPPLPTVILRNFTVPSLLRKKKSNVAPPNPNLIEEIMNLKSIISVDPPIGATPTPLSSPEEEEASIKHTKHDSTATLDESPSASLGASSSSNEGNGEISAAVVASGNENPAMKKSASISNLKKRLSSMKLKSTPYTSPLTPTAEATSSSARAKRKWFSKK